MIAKTAKKTRKKKKPEIVPQFLLDLAAPENGAESDSVVVERICKEFVGAIEKLKTLDPQSRLTVTKRIVKALSNLSKTVACAVFNRAKKEPDTNQLPLTEAEPKEE